MKTDPKKKKKKAKKAEQIINISSDEELPNPNLDFPNHLSFSLETEDFNLEKIKLLYETEINRLNTIIANLQNELAYKSLITVIPEDSPIYQNDQKQKKTIENLEKMNGSLKKQIENLNRIINSFKRENKKIKKANDELLQKNAELKKSTNPTLFGLNANQSN